LGEGRLHREAHPGNGPFLLLVHGILSGRSLWQPNLAALSAVSRPIVVELWGHGRSPSPNDPACYRPQAYVRAFETLRAELGVERWFVCGQSFGAALTLRYALDHPERVIAQVFTNSASALGDTEWVARMRTAIPALADEIERGGSAAIERMPIHPRHARRIPVEYREAVLADAGLVSPQGLAHTMRYGVPESSVRSRIGENRVPTLLVCGERELGFRPHREAAEREMPRLEVVGVDAGHAVNLETAEVFDRAVTDFLGRHAS
jgi:2-succinyl-6-hydroxy-2,4-cyclohexadiene-1-carboxylate synthase